MPKQSVSFTSHQLEISGSQASARQLAAARDAAGKGKLQAKAQQHELAHGLFAPAAAPGLFDQPKET